ncbi:MAG TPA: methyltransferase domain-containing protein [Terriglobia bacterium]|nr:methyltransferase domain-containing protein [Terriglobia bacterium]
MFHGTRIKAADRRRGGLRYSTQNDVRGAALPFKPDSFSAAVAFTMLHHVPSVELQDRLFQEVCRVLRPGGVFAGVDSTDSWLMRLHHISDTLVPIDPQALPARLQSAGFANVSITTDQRGFRFSAVCP